jgi:WXXGXW repeat (2 copies)
MRQSTLPGRRAATLSILGLALGAATLGGCVVAPAYPRYPSYGGYDDGGAVMVAPPAPRYEVIGVAPYPGWLWIGGYWTWRANRHAWVDGHWQAPRHGYRWQPHRWEPISGGRGWRERPGRWN